MKKIFEFFEKITKNHDTNTKFAIGFFIAAVISFILGIVIAIIIGSSGAIIIGSSFFHLSLALFYVTFDKIGQYKAALTTSEVYIKKLEEENMNYKVYTEVILNDREIQEIMFHRMKENNLK